MKCSHLYNSFVILVWSLMRATCSKLKVAINKFQKAFSFIQDKEDIMICMMIVICWSEILSYLGKWAKLIQFDGENEYFCTGKVEKLQIYANVAMFVSLEKLWISCKVSCLFQKHTFDVDQKMSRIYAFRPPLSATVFLVWSIFWVFFDIDRDWSIFLAQEMTFF